MCRETTKRRAWGGDRGGERTQTGPPPSQTCPGRALTRRSNSVIVKLSPKEKEFESPDDIKPNRNQCHQVSTELSNRGSPWKCAVMGSDLPGGRVAWEGQVLLAPGQGRRDHLTPSRLLCVSLRKSNFLFWVLFSDSIHYSWRGRENLHLVSFAWVPCFDGLRRKAS